MVSAFILYYLNIKPTHGYEIQKFLQMSGTEQWIKIQSGSIYYALTKLEKDKFIKVQREERTGSRVRKIYEITSTGKEELKKQMAEELDQPINSICSMKFLTDPILSTLSKEQIKNVLLNHINKLEEQKQLWDTWYQVKIDDSASKLSKLTFQITIENVENQILWHEELLEHLEDYIENSQEMGRIIKSIDFDQMEVVSNSSLEEQKLQYALKLKDEIMNDPQKAVTNLERIIDELERQIKKK